MYVEILLTQEEIHQMEVYSEYLKKIPELLKQLETVEKMYQKAVMEEKMLQEEEKDNYSVEIYSERLERIKKQCEERSADMKEQCRLILKLKEQIENESDVLKKLMK